MTRLACDGPTLMRSVAAAVANLEHHVSEVDALNVFPIPDGDTGSNMLATMRAALTEAERLAPGDRALGRVAEALGRGALRGARGNSGVILAQIVRGMSDGLEGRRRATGTDLAHGLRRAAESAYGSVVTPVEGTILTVIRDAADAAGAMAVRDHRVETVLGVAIEAAMRSVARTPTLLPVLAASGVVDSGGQGLLRLLEGTRLLDGRAPQAGPAPRRPGPGSTPAVPVHAPGSREEHEGFETVFLVESGAATIDLDALRRELGTVGHSVVVAGDASAARVHVHGSDPSRVIAVGMRSGRVSDIAIVDLDARPEPATAAVRPLALAVLAEADGLAALVGSLGGVVVRAAEAVEEAVHGVEAAHVLVLAAEDGGSLDRASTASATCLVVTDVGALVAAMLAFDPDAPPDANLARMSSEAERVQTFTLPDDHDLAGLTLEGLRARAGDGFELVTLYGGPGIAGGVIETVRSAILSVWPEVQVDIVLVGQHRHALLVALD